MACTIKSSTDWCRLRATTSVKEVPGAFTPTLGLYQSGYGNNVELEDL